MKKKGIIILTVIIVLSVFGLLIWRPWVKTEDTAQQALGHYKNGVALYEAGDFEAAETAFTKAVSLNKNNSDFLVMLIDSRLEQNKKEDANATLSILVEKFPELAETKFMEGRLLSLNEEFEEALDKFSLAIEDDEEFARAYLFRAKAYDKLGKAEEALADYLKTAELESELETTALEGAAENYTLLERYSEAIEIYTSFIEKDSTNIHAYLKRASNKKLARELNSAIEDYDMVVSLNPDEGEAFFNRSVCYAMQAKYSQSISDSKVAAEKNYKTGSAWYNAAMAAYSMRNIKDAMTYLQNIPADYEDTSILVKSHNLQGGINMMGQKYSEAIKSFSKAISYDDSHADAFFNRGVAYGMLEDYKSAEKDLLKSKNLGKTSSDVYYALGVQQLNLNKTEEACKNLGKAVDMGHPQARVYQIRHCKNN